MFMKLEMENWKEHPLDSLFHIDRGKALTTENKAMYAGKIPCINGAAENKYSAFWIEKSKRSDLSCTRHRHCPCP